jgi:hypothetical protein
MNKISMIKLDAPSLVTKTMKEMPIRDELLGMMRLRKKEIIVLYGLAYDRMANMNERHKTIQSDLNSIIEQQIKDIISLEVEIKYLKEKLK